MIPASAGGEQQAVHLAARMPEAFLEKCSAGWKAVI